MKQVFALHPWQRPGHLGSNNNQLNIDGVDACQLVEEYGSPLYVYSETKLRENAQSILNRFRQVHANTHICFASKACSNVSVLKQLKQTGLSVEVNSGGEFYKVCHAGFNANEIVFNGVAKKKSEIIEVVSAGIKAINVDSLTELVRIIDIASTIGKQARVSLRIIPEIKGGAAAGWATGTTSSKFGMTIAEHEKAIELINRHPQEIQMTGIHAHIGTQVNDIDAFAAEADFLIQHAIRVNQLLQQPISHINIGGGYPKSYVPTNDNYQNNSEHYKQHYKSQIDFNILAEAIIRPISKAMGSDLEIIVEPGRSLISDAAVLLTRIEAEKQRGQHKLFFLDAGYNVLFDIFIGWYFHMLNASRCDDKDTELYRLAGPLCDSSDNYYDIEGEARVETLLNSESKLAEYKQLFIEQLVRQPSVRQLPSQTKIGDIIAILDTGAYALEMMNDYCGRQGAAAVMIDLQQQSRLIRRRATYEDLLHYDIDT